MDILFMILGILAFIACGGFMAVVQNPLIGHGYGSVGNSTLTVWKGRNVLKAKVTQTHNPKTAAQKAERNVFAQEMLLIKKTSFINQLVSKLPAQSQVDKHGNPRITPPNYLMRVNRSTGAYVRNPTFPYDAIVDLTKFLWSEGAQLNVGAPTAPTVLGLVVSTTWTDNTNPLDPLANATDNVFLIAVEDGYVTNPGSRTNLPPEAILGTTYMRSDAAGSITLPSSWSGKTAHLYIIAGEYRPGTIPASTELIGVSDSIYLGSVAIP